MSNKRFYWLKLNESFFDDDTIQFIEDQENGEQYITFYLKLCLKSLKTEGKLIRVIGKTVLPYDEKSLSRLTNTPVDTVRVAMTLFKNIGLVDILETGELYLAQINEMIGTETDKAQIMRRKRALDQIGSNNVTQIGNDVTQELPKCYTDKEKDADTDIKSKSKKKTTPRKAASLSIPSADDLRDRYGERLGKVLTDWIQYRTDIKHPYKSQKSVDLLFSDIDKKLKEFGADAVIEVFNKSMANGWQGYFFDKVAKDVHSWGGKNVQTVQTGEADTNNPFARLAREKGII